MRNYLTNGVFHKSLKLPALTVIIIVLLIITGLSVGAAITFGSASLTIKQVYSVISWELFHPVGLSGYASGNIHDIVWQIRFPRVVLAMLVGMALSACGAVMQAVVQNPLAEPYTLGLSSGASLGATMAITLGFGSSLGIGGINAMAALGAVAVAFLVLGLADLGGPANTTKLILSGVAVSAICSAFSDFLVYVHTTYDSASQVLFWSMGSLGAADWERVRLALVIFPAGIIFFLTQSRTLNLMLLGEEAAITLGTNLRHVRTVYLIIVSILVGVSVYCCGIIGFVGLIVPHFTRILVGTNHFRLIPVCSLAGGIFLMWADVFSRIILPHSELPIGILVSMIGAPLFIYMMVTKSYSFGGR